MSSTFEVVAQVIADTSEIPLVEIGQEAHAIDDLGIDSLDFLDIVFALDKKFGIKIPMESWTFRKSTRATPRWTIISSWRICALASTSWWRRKRPDGTRSCASNSLS